MCDANSLVVLTSITGARDRLRNDQYKGKAMFIAYLQADQQSDVWKIRPACSAFQSDRRNSRAPKILTHKFVQARYSIWIDGNVALRAPPEDIADYWLRSADIALFRHPIRKSVYEEAEVCAARKLDSPEIIRAQAMSYEMDGLPASMGLGEATVIVRRHSDIVEKFNNHWWAEFCVHSVRDQISFIYSAWKSGLKVNFVTPSKLDHPWFDIKNRRAGLEPPTKSTAGDK